MPGLGEQTGARQRLQGVLGAGQVPQRHLIGAPRAGLGAQLDVRGTQPRQILSGGQGGRGFLIPALGFRGVPGLLGRPSQRQQQVRHQGKIGASVLVQPVIAFQKMLAGAPEVPLRHLDLTEDTTGPGKVFDRLRRFGDLPAPAKMFCRPVVLLEAGEGRRQPDLAFGLSVEVVLSFGQGQRG